MKRVIAAGALAIVGIAPGSAAAQRPYASQGVVELGGVASLRFASITITPDGSDEGSDTSVVDFRLRPLVGYFVIPRLELFGGAQFELNKFSPDQGDDTTSTTYGAVLGAGYYVPAGAVFLGPRLALAYVFDKTESGDDDITTSGPQIQAAGSLRVPFGFGGLLDVSAVLEYARADLEFNDDALGDSSAWAFGIELGFFVFF
jgi:hypothetical protein